MDEKEVQVLLDIEKQARRNRIKTLTAVILIGLVGVILTFLYAYSANQVAELTEKYESVEGRLVRALEKADSASRQFDALQVHMLSLVGQLEDARSRQEQLENRLLGEIHNLEARIGARETPQVTTSDSEVRPSTSLTGWAYLGQYDYDTNQWISSNFSHEKRTAPEKFVNRSLSLEVDGLNVRNNAFFGRVIGSLVRGDKVTVKQLSRYQGGSYVWALISHKKN